MSPQRPRILPAAPPMEGCYGAAAEAAKSFLPELIKLGVILLFVVVLFPLFAFVSLPNILFGFNSSTDQEIIEFTDSAQELTQIYDRATSRTPSILERLVNTILPGFRLPDGSAQYDSYSVTENLGNLNQYWLVAIGSTKYKQDLTAMDEAAVDDLIYGKLDYSTSLIDRVLNITVWDMTPEAYMEKLGFTDEEKEWASLLYSVLVDDQSVSYDDTDGDGYYNTDYGDVTFEHQTPRWCTTIRRTPVGATSSMGRPGRLARRAVGRPRWPLWWPRWWIHPLRLTMWRNGRRRPATAARGTEAITV